MRPLYELSRRLNVARPICNHLLGEEHTHHHQLNVAADIVGYAVHGLGLTPFVEYILAQIVREREEGA